VRVVSLKRERGAILSMPPGRLNSYPKRSPNLSQSDGIEDESSSSP
jgi:hypothetical protein